MPRNQKSDAKPDSPPADQAQANAALVAMVRDAEQYPAPHTADVHPDEVANFAAHGWRAANP